MSISVKKANNGGWRGYVYYYDKNHKRRNKSAGRFKLKKEAREAANELEQELNRQNVNLVDISFVDYYYRWFDLYKKNKVKSHAGYVYNLIGKMIKEYFKDTKLKDIHRSDFQGFVNWYGKDHSYESVRKLKGACHNSVDYAVDDGIIDKDFTKHTELTYNDTKSMKVEYLSSDEITRLRNHVVSKMERYNTSRYMILTAIYTGMRKSEIQALIWKDIDFVNATITVNKSWDEKEKAFKSAKTESSNRVIKVNRKLLKYLEELKANQTTMVFQNSFGTIPTSNALNKCLREIMKDAGINKKDFHFHSLRHVHVAYLIGQGVDIYAISKRLGHANVNITLGVYSYLIDEYKTKNDNLIIDKLNLI